MSFEVSPTGLTHVYGYHPDGSDLPDLIGKANAIAAGLLYERGEVDGLFLSSRPLPSDAPPRTRSAGLPRWKAPPRACHASVR